MTKHVSHRNRSDDWLYNDKHRNTGRLLVAMMEHPRTPVPDLSWAIDTFKDDPKAKADEPKPKIGRVTDDMKCSNPACSRRHNNCVSRTIPSPFGQGWKVLWYCSQDCAFPAPKRNGVKL